jgi:hypothetical protein
VSQNAKNSLQLLLDAFRHARYPDGFPLSRDEDTLAKMLMAEFQDWCNQQGLASVLDKAEKETALSEAAEELEDAFAELAAEGKARSISVPRADGTIERRWSLVTKKKAAPQARPKTQENN